MRGPVLFVLYAHHISDIVSHHSLSHHSLSDDNQLYKSGIQSELRGIIHSTQSCVFDVIARVTNNKLRLNNDKTEIILTALKQFLNSDSVPRSINLNGRDIKLAYTIRNLCVSLFRWRLSIGISISVQMASVYGCLFLCLFRWLLSMGICVSVQAASVWVSVPLFRDGVYLWVSVSLFV